MTPFKLSDELLDNISNLVSDKSDQSLLDLMEEFHYADIAEIIDELSLDEGTYLIKLLDSELTSDILTELDEDKREQILNRLSAREIAEEIGELDTDDAADIIAELPEERVREIINQIEDPQHAKDIVELLRYDENSAGGLMAKELVKVNENWNVLTCVKEMRRQAENVTRVHSIYVVDDNDKLKGRLSLKDLLTTSTKTQISEVYIPKVDYVRVSDKAEEVARLMSKYDLEAVPVIDEIDRLVGRITIDDIIDVIKEEADRDYQMAAGITQEVEADDSVWDLTKARLPWLVLGLLGGLGAVFILEGFEDVMSNPDYRSLFFYTPLIAAMAGNVGVQSSAIIVQGLANDVVRGSLLERLFKEVSLGLINGLALSLLVVGFGFVIKQPILVSTTIALSMMAVIVVAALIGTFVPIILHKKGIDPAIATGPFITTSNDIFGIFLFFYIAKVILGF
ncbi:magnesium transporter [Robertkochia sediminum]|uniref:magnesium transporter n=1 Tax=Robertkochia sediminum TaxID=2785326 RepID=UPI0019328C0A|nr:magnesium transporter [Robertkochia sediminum]MBL7472342.1 magnesium transporter [Robertkochia sediminum]